MTKRSLIWVGRAALLAALIAPVLVYMTTFGMSITANHERWAEMGDAMGGIYTPILSGLTLAVLLLQVRMQSDFNRHTYDESYVQSARSDIDFYLQRLAQELDRPQDYGRKRGLTTLCPLTDSGGMLT